MPPALLFVVESLLDAGYSGWSFFTDRMAYTCYLIASSALIATECYADGRFVTPARQFRSADLLAEGSVQTFRSALISADRRSSSPLAELLLVAVALVWTSAGTS